jgi:hypothetical protein
VPAANTRIAAGARFIGIGFSLGATVAAALWLGDWLDDRWGTSPLFVLLFLTGGLVGFTQRLLWMLRPPRKRGGPEDGPAEVAPDGKNQ